MTVLEVFLSVLLSVIAVFWVIYYRSARKLEKDLIKEVKRGWDTTDKVLTLNRDILNAYEQKGAAYNELYEHYTSLFNAHFDLSQKYDSIQSVQPN